MVFPSSKTINYTQCPTSIWPVFSTYTRSNAPFRFLRIKDEISCYQPGSCLYHLILPLRRTVWAEKIKMIKGTMSPYKQPVVLNLASGSIFAPERCGLLPPHLNWFRVSLLK